MSSEEFVSWLPSFTCLGLCLFTQDLWGDWSPEKRTRQQWGVCWFSPGGSSSSLHESLQLSCSRLVLDTGWFQLQLLTGESWQSGSCIRVQTFVPSHQCHLLQDEVLSIIPMTNLVRNTCLTWSLESCIWFASFLSKMNPIDGSISFSTQLLLQKTLFSLYPGSVLSIIPFFVIIITFIINNFPGLHILLLYLSLDLSFLESSLKSFTTDTFIQAENLYSSIEQRDVAKLKILIWSTI